MPTVRNERGIALAVAVFALVVIGALVAGAFYVGRQEQRIGRNTAFMQQALTSAEEGAYMTLANWDAMLHNDLELHPIGAVTGPDCTVLASGEHCTSVRRLDELLFLIESEGFSQQRFARQRVGLLARLRPLELSVNAALETLDLTTIGGNTLISGNDTTGAWTDDMCDEMLPSLPGIRINSADNLAFEGRNWEVGGSPGDIDGVSIDVEESITSDELLTFGDADWEVLRSMATLVLNPADLPAGDGGITTLGVGGQIAPASHVVQIAGEDVLVCNRGVRTNWGEPWLAGMTFPAGQPFEPVCSGYFPVIYVAGSAALTQHRGQGVLIIEGDLYVTGGIEFYGPVIVRGAFVTEGGGADPAHFYGGVIAGRVSTSGVDNRLAGRAQIYYSNCAITRALQGGAKPWPLQERSWANMY